MSTSMFIIALLLLAVSIVLAMRWPSRRRTMLFGALTTLPLIAAELLFGGALDRFGIGRWQQVQTLLTLISAFISSGALAAAVADATITLWLNPAAHPNRRRLFWLLGGSVASLALLMAGQPAPVALMVGVVINGLLLITIERELIWDAVATSFSFAVLFLSLDLAFGIRASGDISHLLINQVSIGVVIAGLPIERLLTVALIGALIGPLFSATKFRRTPAARTGQALAPAKVLTVAGVLLALTVSAAWATNTYVLPPAVRSVTPAPNTTNVSTSSTIVVKFNRPVERQTLSIATTAEIDGSWSFQQPEFGDHGFRQATFTYAAVLPSNVKIHVVISDIRSTWRLRGPNYLFSFTTAPAPPVVVVPPTPVPVPVVPTPEPISLEPTPISPPVIVPAPPVHQKILAVTEDYQDQPLSCEAAALKMALSAHGVHVSESQIMKIVGYDPTPHVGNTWGDPQVGFVGNIAGSQNTTGYGVYWNPIAKAAKNWRPSSRTLTNGTLTDLTAAIDAGNAVVLWGTIGKAYSQTWKTPAGKTIAAWHGEHARTLIGYIGPASAPTKFVINDPVAGRVTWSSAALLANWIRFYNSAVVVE